ncbi:MAG: hypothetical protein AAF589_02485 [Planctomycetota bacterium]
MATSTGEFLVLLAVVSITLGWVLHRFRLARRIAAAIALNLAAPALSDSPQAPLIAMALAICSATVIIKYRQTNRP